MDLFARFSGSRVAMLSTMELHDKYKGANRPFILDVREPEEFREGHIPWANLIPRGILKTSRRDLLNQREIVYKCASGSRSSSTARMLALEGYQVLTYWVECWPGNVPNSRLKKAWLHK